MRIGFISTRLAGNDGVTLETEKWAHVCRKMGHEVFFCAGLLDPDMQPGLSVPEMHFAHPEILAIQNKCFGVRTRPPETSEKIRMLAGHLKAGVRKFVSEFNIQLLVPENAITIPMNLPLGLAIAEFIAESGIPTLAHHHDFYWERQRFTVNAVNDILDAAFPADFSCIRHAVINTPARRELAQRKGVPSTIVPNVFDFERELPAADEYARDLREQIGISPDDILILQPTRVISRKGIEHSIELVRRLKNPRAKLVVSHSAGDEGMEYSTWLMSLAQSQGVDMRMIANRLNETRKFDENGKKIYTLWDVYRHADFVTYPSIYEGFGNAFLEAVYFRKPILVNRYSVYAVDIEPLGFETVFMDGYVTEDVVAKVRALLSDTDLRHKMTDRNYSIARKHFSFGVLERALRALFAGSEPAGDWMYP